ncbi:hypothetical protein HK097_010828 [Rhizophlyctis rosea]|uniref:Uncharacterized protein n=1 Tax=Rhizophlyctis rosea TaxID=64517 RepID=A0AAD5SK17_9FUNG|nr:hypothetical protein HK097_010828 [Rhizophlyctis rosea]
MNTCQHLLRLSARARSCTGRSTAIRRQQPGSSLHSHTLSTLVHPPYSRLSRTLTAITLPLSLILLHLTLKPPAECSPKFNGVPVAATFLMHQALSRFEAQFPGLEMSAVFDTSRPEEYSYHEEGLLASILPSVAVAVVPVFEKLTEAEEAKLGGAGIRKKPVGKIEIRGSCSVGCAAVELKEMKVMKPNGDVVWEWKKSK